MLTQPDPPELSVAPQPDGIVLTVRWMHPSHLWWWPRLTLLLAVLLGLALGVRYALAVAQSWPLLIPLALFVGIPAFALLQSALSDLANRTVLRLDAEELHVTWGPLGKGERRMARGDIAALRIVVARWRAMLGGIGPDGTGKVLARQLTPEAALAVARHLGRELQVDLDADTAREVPRRPYVRIAISSIVALGFVGYAVWSLSQPAIRDLVVELDILEGPAAAAVTLEEDTTAAVWMRMSLGIDEVINTERTFLDDFPRLYLLETTFAATDGRSGTLTCDPLDIAFFVDQSSSSGVRASTVSWYGRVDDCTVALPPGELTVTAELVAQIDDARFTLREAELLLRR